MQDTFSSQPPEELPNASSLSQINGEETQNPPTLSSREMPQWLLSELKAGKSQEIKGVRRSYEVLTGNERHLANLPHQLSSMRESQFIGRRERGGCLTTWLVFVGIANTLALIFWLAMTSTLGPFSLFYAATSAMVLIGVVGAWRLKKWGYYTLLAFSILSVVAGLLAISSSASPFIGSLIGLFIIAAFMVNKWEDFE